MFFLAVLIIVIVFCWTAKIACGTISTTQTWAGPMSCCCRKFTCGGSFPGTLSFIGIIHASCSQALISTLSGTLTFGVDTTPETTCDDVNLQPDCTLAGRYCGGVYRWKITPGTEPTCGPYINEVSFQCGDFMDPPGSTPGSCPHLKYAECYFSGGMVVQRTDAVYPHAPPCPLIEGGVVQHAVQNPDCTWTCVDGAGPPEPNNDCPRCTAEHNHCDPLINCCTDGTGCEFHGPESPITDGYFEILSPSNPPDNDPSCLAYCPGITMQYRRYTFRLRSCQFPDDIVGCNPTGCPPDDDNTGDFFAGFNFCGNDKLYVFCPGNQEEMAAHMIAMGLKPKTDVKVKNPRLFKPCRHHKHKPNCQLCRQHKDNPAFREAIHALILDPAKGGRITTPSEAVGPLTGVGSELAKVFDRISVPKDGCMGSCGQLERELNEMGPDGAEANIEIYATKLYQRAKANYTRWERAIVYKNVAASGIWLEMEDPTRPFWSFLKLAIAAERKNIADREALEVEKKETKNEQV